MAEGANKCQCGYDHIAATTGRPLMSESMALPASPLIGRGLNFNMGLGLLLAFGGIGLAVAVHLRYPVSIPHPYIVATGAVGLGLLRYARGCAQARSE